MTHVPFSFGTTLTALLMISSVQSASAQTAMVDVHKISATSVGEKIGTVAISDSARGLELIVKLSGLPAGTHGFHVHEKGNCGPGEKNGRVEAGIAAGDHYDPESIASHKGPDGKGHKGDLPALKLEAEGGENIFIAPRLKLSEIRGRSLMVHEGGDTNSDPPESGGGKGRIACGVIPKT